MGKTYHFNYGRVMFKTIAFTFSLIFVFQGCSMVKGLFGKKAIGDPNDPDFLNRVQELKSAYREGNIQALDELINLIKENGRWIEPIC